MSQREFFSVRVILLIIMFVLSQSSNMRDQMVDNHCWRRYYLDVTLIIVHRRYNRIFNNYVLYISLIFRVFSLLYIWGFLTINTEVPSTVSSLPHTLVHHSTATSCFYRLCNTTSVVPHQDFCNNSLPNQNLDSFSLF